MVALKLMEEMKAKHPCVGNVRNQGLFRCIDKFVKNRESREPIVWNATGEVMSAVQETLTAKGCTCIFAGIICLWSRRSSSMQSS